MDWNNLSLDERLIAEQAVATYRAVKCAGDQAPHGKGLACLEEAVLTHGQALLRDTLRRVIDAQAEAQKKGVRVSPAPAAPRPGSSVCPASAC